MTFLTNLLLTLTSLAYPLIWLWVEDKTSLFYLPYAMAILWAVKGLLQAEPKQRFFAFVLAALLFFIGLTRSVDSMYWYPVIINGFLLAIFGGSLWRSQTVVERLARLQTPDLSEAGVRYTRKVTQIWCGFFIFNIATASLLIFWQFYEAWAIFTGLISYFLMALLMAGEWLVRQRVKQQHSQTE
ncbi:hypothetical protein A4G20_10595 [Pasteurellaceae bacterium RH1A]|nr:hypothetical protein A4G20_10595 [Pasteurellaceae bacterium RH1A]